MRFGMRHNKNDVSWYHDTATATTADAYGIDTEGRAHLAYYHSIINSREMSVDEGTY